MFDNEELVPSRWKNKQIIVAWSSRVIIKSPNILQVHPIFRKWKKNCRNKRNIKILVSVIIALADYPSLRTQLARTQIEKREWPFGLYIP